MLERNLNYIAGLFDGEGCVRIHKKIKANTITYSPLVEMNITNEEVVDYLVQHVGGHKYVKTWNNDKGWKTVYRWIMSKQGDVYTFLNEIKDLTIIKKLEIEETLLWYEGKNKEEVYYEVRRLKHG